MRTAIYLRISQDKTGEEAGVNRQREDCVALAERLDWQVVEVYQDNDVSASSGKPRPNYRRMLADIEAGKIDAVVCWHPDRLYRRLRDLEDLADICGKHQIMVRTCRAGEFDLSTPTGRMLAGILASVAKGEVEVKADRWQRSVRQRRESGRWWNSAGRMFGYTRDGVVVEDEAEILRQSAADILAGASVHAVCQRLERDGVKTTRGNDWTPPSLRVTLRSPKIAGLSALKGQIIGPGQWEPILDRPTWERVVAAINTGRRQAPAPRRALLSGLVFCGVDDCGLRLYRSSRGGVHRYACRTYYRMRGHITVDATHIEQMVEAAARAALSSDRVRAAIAARLSNAGAAAADLTADIDRIDSEIREREAELEQAGSRSRVAAMRAIDDLDAQLTAKREQLAALTPVALPVGDEWPDDIERRAALIELVVKRVVVLPHDRSRGGTFDPGRVQIVPVAQEPIEHR